ncbi:MAG: hypothetical protein GY934_01885, partial [Gammaproteobacteria bacterium]|nr:hypothetical protein [Gammaproteobacteria bacterium]
DNGVDDGFEAEIFSIDLSTLDLFVGVGASLDSNTNPTDSVTGDAVGFGVDNGNLNLVIAIDELTDNVYTGLEISVDEVGLQGIEGLTLIASGKVLVNHASSGDDSNPEIERLNWHVAGTTNDTGDLLADFDSRLISDLEFLVEGSMTLGIRSFILASGAFKVLKTTVELNHDEDDATALVSAELLSVSLINVETFGGMGASFDTDGTILYADAVGFYVGAAHLYIDIVQYQSDSWMGLSGSLGTAELIGVPAITFTATDAVLLFNHASNGLRLDWSDGDDGLEIRDSLTDDVQVQISGNVTIGIDSFVLVSGSFEILKSAIELDHDENDLTALVDADLLSVSLTAAEAFGGVGASFDTDGSILYDHAMGFYAGSANVSLNIVRYAGNTWTGFSASLGIVDMVGVAGVDFIATDINLLFNYASNGSLLDWTDQADDGDELPVLIGLDDSVQLQISANGILTISSFVHISGSLAFERRDDLEVTPVGTTQTKTVSVLTVGARDVNAFVGTGGPYFQDSDGDGDIDQDDELLDEGAVGVALSQLQFGLVLMNPTDSSDTSFYYALTANAAIVELIGVEGVILQAENLSVNVNGSDDSDINATGPPPVV